MCSYLRKEKPFNFSFQLLFLYYKIDNYLIYIYIYNAGKMSLEGGKKYFETAKYIFAAGNMYFEGDNMYLEGDKMYLERDK